MFENQNAGVIAAGVIMLFKFVMNVSTLIRRLRNVLRSSSVVPRLESLVPVVVDVIVAAAAGVFQALQMRSWWAGIVTCSICLGLAFLLNTLLFMVYLLCGRIAVCYGVGDKW